MIPATAPFHAEVASAPEGALAVWITAADGVRLRAVAWAGGRRGTAVLFPGRTECVEKFGPVAAKLVARGLSVLAIDWRGQGLSDRHPLKPMLGHVEDFRHYQRDVAALFELDAQLDLPEPHYLIAHSMGGTIGLRTLLERSAFCGAVFSAPMWHLHMRSATRELTTKMARIANALGLGARLTPGTNAEPSTLAVGFAANALTSDPAAYAWMLRQITAHPELSLGGPSVQWTYAALEEMARLYVAPLPRIPVLTFLGTGETVVSPSVIRSQMTKMTDGRLVVCEGARHEIFMEAAPVQDLVWREIDAFMAAVPARRGGRDAPGEGAAVPAAVTPGVSRGTAGQGAASQGAASRGAVSRGRG